jgi:hypothetical protein
VESRFGPVSFSVFGITDVPIPAASSLGPIAMRWPRAVFVTDLTLLATAPDLSRFLSIRIQDETFQDILIQGGDGQGNDMAADTANRLIVLEPQLPDFVRVRRFPLQRPVLDHDTWWITVTNSNAADPVTPELHFGIADGMLNRADLPWVPSQDANAPMGWKPRIP